MKTIKLVFFLLIICKAASSQAILLNGNFEDGNYDWYLLRYINFDSNCEHWESDYYNGGNGSGHSPDWEAVYPSEVNKWVEMYKNEFIQQDLSNRLQPSTVYNIEFNVYLIEQYDQAQENNQYTGYHLNFYLAKNKIKYKEDIIAASPCDPDYSKLDNPEDVKIIQSFDMSNLENQEWITLRFLYFEPDELSELSGYNWFGIEMVGPDYEVCNGGKIKLDEVSILTDTQCTYDNCDRTDGPHVASSPYSYKSPNGPKVVDHLDNIEEAKNIRIKNILGQTVCDDIQDVYSLNGISNPIFWDGKENGNFVGYGTYYWQMDLINACGTQNYLGKFIISTAITDPIPNLGIYNNSVTIPLSCCYDLEDFVIDYDLYGVGSLEFKALNTITLEGMTISNTLEELHFTAEESITIGFGVLIESGPDILFEIKICEYD